MGYISVEIVKGIGDDEAVAPDLFALSVQAAMRDETGQEARLVLGDALLESGHLVVVGDVRERVQAHLDAAAAAWARRAVFVSMFRGWGRKMWPLVRQLEIKNGGVFDEDRSRGTEAHTG